MGEPTAGRDGILARTNFNTVLAAGCIAFSAFLLLAIPYQVDRPPVLFGQSATSLDPTLFPTLVAVGFLLVGGWYMYRSFALDEVNAFRGLSRGIYGRLAVAVVIFIVYASLLEPLGFVLSSAVAAGALSVFLGARSVLGVLFIAIGVPAAVYIVFRRALSVALPELPDF